MSSVLVVTFISVWFRVVKGLSTVPYAPEVTPHNLLGRVTSTTLTLQQPVCFFNNLSGLPCAPDNCEIWLVIARGDGVPKFEAIKGNTSVLMSSPYPDAFRNNSSPNYFLTKLGVQNAFPCAESTGFRFFRVGDEGLCSTSNCNGILPAGSTVRAKYVLLDPGSKQVVSESQWSSPISLIALSDSAGIDEWIGKRSGGMIVVTSILSSLLAILLLFLLTAFVLRCTGFQKVKQDVTMPPALGSVRVKKYSTHNVRNAEAVHSPGVTHTVTTRT